MEKLPVLKHKHITEKEMVWAGKREGDFFGIIHGIFSSLFFYLSYSTYSNFKLFFLISISLAVLFLIWYIKYERKFPKKANKDKLHELEEYKNNLIHNEKDKVKNSITSFQKKLKNFSTWKLISPKQEEIYILFFQN